MDSIFSFFFWLIWKLVDYESERVSSFFYYFSKLIDVYVISENIQFLIKKW